MIGLSPDGKFIKTCEGCGCLNPVPDSELDEGSLCDDCMELASDDE